MLYSCRRKPWRPALVLRGAVSSRECESRSQSTTSIVKLCMTTTELDPTTPEALMRCFADRLNTADLDGLVALYEPSAVFEPQPGVVVRGHTAIRQALDELLAISRRSSPTPCRCSSPATSALVVNEWVADRHRA